MKKGKILMLKPSLLPSLPHAICFLKIKKIPMFPKGSPLSIGSLSEVIVSKELIIYTLQCIYLPMTRICPHSFNFNCKCRERKRACE